MKKFPKDFSEYDIPMSLSGIAGWVEGERRSVVSYKNVVENPVYYLNHFQYLGGEFYRLALGVDTFWDRELDVELTMNLRDYLHELEDDARYWVRSFITTREVVVEGILWKDNVQPDFRKQSFVRVNPQWTKTVLPPKSVICVRKNEIDSPFRCDVELYDKNESRVKIISMKPMAWRIREQCFKQLPPNKLYEFVKKPGWKRGYH